MELKAYRITMYKCIIDSGWIEVSPLTVLVGKNESGKTTLLKALHKLNPFRPEPYKREEWPRGRRDQRNDSQVVCEARFELNADEIAEIESLTGERLDENDVHVTRDYAGKIEVIFPGNFLNKLHPNDIDNMLSGLPPIKEPISDAFREKARECLDCVQRMASEGRLSELSQIKSTHYDALNAIINNEYTLDPTCAVEFINEYQENLQQIVEKIPELQSLHQKAHEYIINCLPVFIYMSDYRAFAGTADLNQVKQRKDSNTLSEEDNSLITILELAGLSLDEEVQKVQSLDREERQYDLADASSTLTRQITERWKQRKYEVEFRADGNQFYTFVKDDMDPSLIKLEERSKGFQWFFSFDLMFMHESNGTFKNCVILLDEPGLSLHPDAQTDLLKRMEEYAKDNTLIYTTHLPFMIDLRYPERIRVLSESKEGTVVTESIIDSQPEGKLVLQAALGMSGSTSFLVAQSNLVVEGVDDFWIITELSRLLRASGNESLPDDLFITPAGGASEAVYIATFMIGQKLDVVVLFDADRAGFNAKDKLVKSWLAKYNGATASVLTLKDCIASDSTDYSIEDIFTEKYYKDKVLAVYKDKLTAAGCDELELKGNDQLVKKVERCFEQYGLEFNKGSVAKLIRKDLMEMNKIDELPENTKEAAISLISAIVNNIKKK